MIIRDELSYRQRIALPPDTVAVVEWRAGPAPTGEIVAERQFPLGGRQVPIDFTFEVSPADIRPGFVHVVRGALRISGGMHWISEPLAIDTKVAEHDLGTLMLEFRWRSLRPARAGVRVRSAGVLVKGARWAAGPVVALSANTPLAQRKIRLVTPWQVDFGRIGCRRCSYGASVAT